MKMKEVFDKGEKLRKKNRKRLNWFLYEFVWKINVLAIGIYQI